MDTGYGDPSLLLNPCSDITSQAWQASALKTKSHRAVGIFKRTKLSIKKTTFSAKGLQVGSQTAPLRYCHNRSCGCPSITPLQRIASRALISFGDSSLTRLAIFGTTLRRNFQCADALLCECRCGRRQKEVEVKQSRIQAGSTQQHRKTLDADMTCRNARPRYYALLWLLSPSKLDLEGSPEFYSIASLSMPSSAS